MTAVPCAARPDTKFFHPEGSCQCFVGGPAPEFPPEENVNESNSDWWKDVVDSTNGARAAFEGFAAVMSTPTNKQHGPIGKKKHGKDRLHVKLR